MLEPIPVTSAAPSSDAPKTMMQVHCPPCGVTIDVIEAPCLFDAWVRAMRSAFCPVCHSGKLYVGAVPVVAAP